MNFTRLKYLFIFFFILLKTHSLYAYEIDLVGFKFQKISREIEDTIVIASEKYGSQHKHLNSKILNVFLHTIIHRESSFKPDFCNYADRIEGDDNWNHQIKTSSWPTEDHYPHGCGLTQITGWHHGGIPYPWNKKTPPKTIDLGIYGKVSPKIAVTKLTDPFNPEQNVQRFLTEHVFPLFDKLKAQYPFYKDEVLLRMVAFHWNKGNYTSYNAYNFDYLDLYDKYFSFYNERINTIEKEKAKIKRQSEQKMNPKPDCQNNSIPEILEDKKIPTIPIDKIES